MFPAGSRANISAANAQRRQRASPAHRLVVHPAHGSHIAITGKWLSAVSRQFKFQIRNSKSEIPRTQRQEPC
jgi:hypothetical protein